MYGESAARAVRAISLERRRRASARLRKRYGDEVNDSTVPTKTIDFDQHSFRQRIVLHRSPVALIFEMLPFVLLLCGAYVVASGLGRVLSPQISGVLADPAGHAFNMARVGLVLEGLRRYYNDVFILGERRVAHHGGRLWIKLHSVNVKYIDIRELEIKQSIFGRIFDFGTVLVNTASKSESEVQLINIHHPEKYMNLINERRDIRRRELDRSEQREEETSE